MTPREGVDDFGRIVGSLIDAWEQMPNDLRDERLDRRMADLVTFMEKRPAPHPAATAREEAWKAMVEALEFYENCANYDIDFGLGNIGDLIRQRPILADDGAKARRALALARSTGGGA